MGFELWAMSNDEMWGFFPLHGVQGQNDKQEQTTAKCGGSLHCALRAPVGMTAEGLEYFWGV